MLARWQYIKETIGPVWAGIISLFDTYAAFAALRDVAFPHLLRDGILSWLIPSIVPWYVWLLIGCVITVVAVFEVSFRATRELVRKLQPEFRVKGIDVNSIDVILPRANDFAETGSKTTTHAVVLHVFVPTLNSKSVTGLEVTIIEGFFEGRNLRSSKLRHNAPIYEPARLNPGDQKLFSVVSAIMVVGGNDYFNCHYIVPDGVGSSQAINVKAVEEASMKVRITAIDNPAQEWEIRYGVRGKRFHASAFRTLPTPDTQDSSTLTALLECL